MNNKVQQFAEQEIDDLISIADMLIYDAKNNDSGFRPEKIGETTTWISRTGQLIRKLYNGEGQHYENYQRLTKQKDFTNVHSNNYTHICEVQGILKAIKHELNRGLLTDLRSLLQAGIFADFLEMAEHLLSEGYKDASAVTIGAVLEDSLRKLADKNGISTVGPSGRPLTIDPLNVALAKASVYGPLVQKQVTTWADLRNSAAHGHYNRYDEDQVKQMLLFVQKFCSDYLQ
jgi:hypothetical protein